MTEESWNRMAGTEEELFGNAWVDTKATCYIRSC